MTRSRGSRADAEPDDAVTQLIVKHCMTTQTLMAMLRRYSTPMLEKLACLVAWREVMP